MASHTGHNRLSVKLNRRHGGDQPKDTGVFAGHMVIGTQRYVRPENNLTTCKCSVVDPHVRTLDWTKCTMSTTSPEDSDILIMWSSKQTSVSRGSNQWVTDRFLAVVHQKAVTFYI